MREQNQIELDRRLRENDKETEEYLRRDYKSQLEREEKKLETAEKEMKKASKHSSWSLLT